MNKEIQQIEKYFLGHLDQEASIQLFKKLETDASLKKEFICFQSTYALTQLLPRTDDKEMGEKSYLNFKQKQKGRHRKRLWIQIIRNAAIAALLIGATWYISKLNQEVDQSNAMNTLFVPAGQRAQLMLNDGTEVWLNAQSTLSYPAHFSGKERKVSLVGEAYFNVAKDDSKPFVVSSKDIDMKVLGTKFNVFAYENSKFIETHLLEGSIKVYKKGYEKDGRILKPNDLLHYENGNMLVKKANSNEYLLWKEGIYCFEKEPLESLIERLELYYDVKIVVENKSIRKLQYTGKFRQRDGIYEILRIMQKVQKFEIVRDEIENTITLK
ncbi:anti-sigma factor [Bacteroidales bacterium]|nr:anti-sigma factor [Bacteroidales bacterium]